jgi:hypothetical protein
MKLSTTMKLSTFAAVLVVLVPVTLYAQTDAMPPETKAPAQHDHAAGSMAMHDEKPPVPPSKSVSLSFEGKTATLSLTELATMPMTTVMVHNSHRNADETYSGPLLSDVLARVGLTSSRETEPLILHSTIIATGTDHYFVLYSGAEIQPSFSTGKVIVAVMKSGLPDNDGGLIQLINTCDAKPARWVHGLMSLSVMSVAPSN